MTQSEIPLDHIVQDELSKARERANEGSPVFVAHLMSAKYAASKAGIDVSAQIAEIEQIGYAANVRVSLDLARERALAKGSGFEILLRSAKMYAREAGMDISQQAGEIIALYNDGKQAKKQA